MAFYERNRSRGGFYKSVGVSRNLNFHPHLHNSFELLSVLEGEITVQVEQREYRLGQGQQILILPNLIHGYRGENSLTQLIIFSVDFLPEIRREGKNGLFRHPVLEGSDREYHRMEEVFEDHFAFRAELYRLAGRYAKNGEVPLSARRDNEFAVWISDYLEAHCTEPICEKTVAKAIGYHPRYLSQRINQNFGVSFKVLLNEYRIRIAQDLLSDSSKTVTEIYTLSGFDSQSAFNRNFKIITGLTPREYRRKKTEQA